MYIICVYISHQLLDDYALVRPSVIAGTPRFWNMIYNKYLQAVQVAFKDYLMKPQYQSQEELDMVIEREVFLNTLYFCHACTCMTVCLFEGGTQGQR